MDRSMYIAKAKSCDEVIWTALHTAALLGDSDWVAALIHGGADVNLEDAGGRTPLQWAERMGHVHVASLLRSYGARETRPQVRAG